MELLINNPLRGEQKANQLKISLSRVIGSCFPSPSLTRRTLLLMDMHKEKMSGLFQKPI